MKRAEMLDTAKTIVTKDRQADYGKPEDSFADICGLWSAYLERELTSADVANMMILLKVARAKTNPKHQDNWLDIAGYAACGCEIATAEKEPKYIWHYRPADSLPLIAPVCGSDESNMHISEIVTRVNCPACLKKIAEMAKAAMGFGPGTPSESQVQDLKRAVNGVLSDPDVPANKCGVKPLPSGKPPRSGYGAFCVHDGEKQVVYDVMDVIDAFSLYWTVQGGGKALKPSDIPSSCFVYTELKFKEPHVQMLCNIYRQLKGVSQCTS